MAHHQSLMRELFDTNLLSMVYLFDLLFPKYSIPLFIRNLRTFDSV